MVVLLLLLRGKDAYFAAYAGHAAVSGEKWCL